MEDSSTSSESQTWDENMARLRYQYGGDRYQFQGTAHSYTSRIVDQEPSNYAYPREDPPITFMPKRGQH